MQSLQDDMDNLLQWEQDWQMEFHLSKCQLLRITNKRKPFARDYDIHGQKKNKKKQQFNAVQPTLDFLTCDRKHTYFFLGLTFIYTFLYARL